ncbi:MAG: hypothetical protein KIT81_09605 [Alphaproteobacteria bacterium]|nr:hypothetical protein [Alphaproteobacteria bacterium]MCW5751390.1 hypothetical protein [Alphaproteobacteria bacterium]
MQGKVLLVGSATKAVYVGIDVCKDWLDVYVDPLGDRWRIANTPQGLRGLRRRLAGLPVALIVLEATGKFHRQVHRGLHAAGFAVGVINPLRARLFAEAAGPCWSRTMPQASPASPIGRAICWASSILAGACAGAASDTACSCRYCISDISHLWYKT